MASTWERDVLATLQAPVTTGNLRLLRSWQRAEGGHTHNSATWNWLNTTKGRQFPSINSVGVRAFPDYKTGVAYTADTILGGYPGIVTALRTGKPYHPKFRSQIISDFSKWVSGDRSSRPDYGQKILGMKTTSQALSTAVPAYKPPKNRYEMSLSDLAGALDDGDEFWDLVQMAPLEFPTAAFPSSMPQEIEPEYDATGKVSQAVSIARKQIGADYVWGAESPEEGGFDCSGLIDYAFRKAGIDLPGRMTSQSALSVGKSVKGKRLAAGDIIVVNDGKHVVMYMGGGRVIAAPHRGEKVQYQPLSKFNGSIVDVRRVK